MALDATQEKIIKEDSIVLSGGPGTGKTKCLIEKIRHLIVEEKLEAKNILILCSLNSGIGQLKVKLDDSTGSKEFFISNAQTFSREVCGEQFFNLIDLNTKFFTEREQEQVVEEIFQTLFEKDINYKQIKDIVSSINYLRAKVNHTETDFVNTFEKLTKISKFKLEKKIWRFGAEVNLETFKKIFTEYCSTIDSNKKDWNEIIMNAISQLKDPSNHSKITDSWKYLFVEEFQDNNEISYELIKELIKVFKKKVWIIGDSCQTTNEYCGSVKKIFNKFIDEHKEFTHIHLKNNHRSSTSVVNACNKLFPENDLIAQSKEEGFIEWLTFSDLQSEGKYIGEKIIELVNKHDAAAEVVNFAILNRTLDDVSSITAKINAFFRHNKPQSGDMLEITKVSERWKSAEELKLVYFFIYLWSFDLNTASAKSISYAWYKIWSQREQKKPFVKADIDCINNYWEKHDHTNLLILNDMPKNLGVHESKKEAGQDLYELITKIKSVTFESLKKPTIMSLVKELWNIAGLKSFSEKFENVTPIKRNEIIKTVQEKFKGYVIQNKNRNSFHVLASNSLKSLTLNLKPKQRKQMGPKQEVYSLNMHQTTGLEFDYVFICGLIESNIPSFYAKEIGTTENLLEEKRLFYKSVSSAKKGLYLLTAIRKYSTSKEPTRFLGEII